MHRSPNDGTLHLGEIEWPFNGSPAGQWFQFVRDEEALANVLVIARATFDAREWVDELEPAQRRRAKGIEHDSRFEEYVGTRWLLARWHAKCATGDEWPLRSISHCRTHLAVALGRDRRLGLDIECRTPTHLAAVAERLGWPEACRHDRAAGLRAWTLWEAWRKAQSGSVLDVPDSTYAAVLRELDALSSAPRRIGGHSWASHAADQCVFSIVSS